MLREEGASGAVASTQVITGKPGLENLLRLFAQLGPEEHEVLVACAEGLLRGRQTYGAINPEDGRNWINETREEARDGLNYLSALIVKLNRLQARHPELVG